MLFRARGPLHQYFFWNCKGLRRGSDGGSCGSDLSADTAVGTVPRLTAREWRALQHLEVIAGYPLTQTGVGISTGILRRLIRAGCIQVMGLSPARYRVTKLGKVARSLGVRS